MPVFIGAAVAVAAVASSMSTGSVVALIGTGAGMFGVGGVAGFFVGRKVGKHRTISARRAKKIEELEERLQIESQRPESETPTTTDCAPEQSLLQTACNFASDPVGFVCNSAHNVVKNTAAAATRACINGVGEELVRHGQLLQQASH